MKLLFKQVFLFTLLLIAMTGCEKGDENNPPALKPAEEQVKEIVDVLGKNPDVSEFTSVLSKLNVADVDADELTIFAVKNGGTKSKSVTKADLDGNSIKRHIVKGAYKISDLKDGMTLTSISKDTLVISIKGEEVQINKVPIQTKGEVVGKSIYYIVPDVIPLRQDIPLEPSVEEVETTIIVNLCNEDWSPEYNKAGFPIDGAKVDLYAEVNGKLELKKSYSSENNGKVVFTHPINLKLYYVVHKGDTTSLHKGFMVEGLYVSQTDLDNSPVNKLFEAEPGDLKYMDLNGDNMIDNQDKTEDAHQPIRYEGGQNTKEIQAYIVSPTFRQRTMTLTVLACNSNWAENKLVEGIPASGASVKLYTKVAKDYRLVMELKTSETGQVIIPLEGFKAYYYTVEKEDATPFINDYQIVGLCTTEDDLNILVDGDKPVLGGLKYMDVNKDGRIDANDKHADHHLPILLWEDEKNWEEMVYIAPPSFTSLIDILSKSLSEVDKDMISFQKIYREVDAALTHEANGVSFGNNQKLNTLASSIWDPSYKMIRMILRVDNRYSSDAVSAGMRAEWASKSPQYWLVFAYAYTELLNYFGGVPILATPDELVSRASEEEVLNYTLDILLSKVVQSGSIDQKNAANMLAARLLMRKADYQRAAMSLKDVMNSGVNSLITDNVFDSSDNAEVIWGGFADHSSVAKGKYSHILRYTETLLLLGECALQLGQMNEALAVVNQIYRSKGLPLLSQGATKDDMTQAIQSLWKSDMASEGVMFGNFKRWGTFLNELGKYEAKDYNRLLPIPMDELAYNPYLSQNPGY